MITVSGGKVIQHLLWGSEMPCDQMQRDAKEADAGRCEKVLNEYPSFTMAPINEVI